MQNVDVTIAIPVYNVEKYVEHSVVSALEQQFNGTYEVLVVDDKGSDNSMQVVRCLQQTHARGNVIRIIEHEQNKGLGEASNTAIKTAQGKYLLFLDSDDWLSSNALSILYENAIHNNAEVVIGSYQEIYEDGTNGKIHRYHHRLISHPNALIYDYAHHHEAPNIHRWNKLFRIDFLRQNNILCVHRIMEDSVFDFEWRVLASKVSLVDNVTLYYNIRQGSIMTSIHHQKGRMEYAEVYASIIKEVQGLIREKYAAIEGIYDYYYMRLYNSILQLCNTDYTEEQRLVFEEAAIGCNDFVPSWRMLYHSRYRFVALWCKLHHKQDCETFIEGYKRSRSAFGYLCRIVLKFIPVKNINQ